MCGITGILHKYDRPVDLAILQKMNRRLAHRGPDDEGYFVEGSVGLGHRRLSIIDLSSGHQPMQTPDKRYTIVFNGEIYNFLEIRSDLEKQGVLFQTHSDTEVLLTLYAMEGKKCLKRLNGMFSFAVWDNKERRLFAACDRMGKKPFYYWDAPSHFAFASECKAFQGHPDFKSEADQEALSHYFQYEYVPAPYSIFRGVRKLPAGHSLVYDQTGLTIKPYWDVPLSDEKCEVGEAEACEKIMKLLDRAVEYRMISDVPLGVFLSGGIDSSAVVGLMARHRSGKDIKTFSINFDEPSFDESAYSSFVAKHFSTDHHFQTLSAQKLIDILPEVAGFLDEPFADYSVIPTYLLSRFTRQTVTVVLGGDGGDELFAGYPTFYADRMARWFTRLPQMAQRAVTRVANALPVSRKDMSLEFMAKQFLYGACFPPVIRNQVWLGAFHQEEQDELFLNQNISRNPLRLVDDVMKNCRSSHPGDRVLYFYQKFYLCGDILVKTDRASMAASLEVRAPFLDINLIEYVSKLPFEMKLKGRATKYILKKALEKVLPSPIIHRKKKGFGIPIALWLRRELKGMLTSLLNREKIKEEGIFNADYIDRLVAGHLSGKKNNRKPLFSLLMFQLWRENFF
ncbi:MAG: asparagine synthase (glutamine-hydrolyzing) [Deltaproteobacteria bacterium]|nr:asparagine synthase (glutamine-hydrolyzing) [Deltaproteobacteria bacterium]